MTHIVDSLSGPILGVYDDLDRLTSETTRRGVISYTYDDAGRRATATVAGQPTVVYSFDSADLNRTVFVEAPIPRERIG